MVKPIFEVDDLDPEPVAEFENKFYKTTFTIEVLSEGTPIEWSNLEDLHSAITDGPFSGLVETVTTEELTSMKAAAELIQQGSDPGFFGLEEFDQDARKLIDMQKTDEVRATEWNVVLQLGIDIVKVVQATGATDMKKFETALRNAVKEFTNTPEGKEYCEEICGDFNWADAFLQVPDSIWSKHGIYIKPEKDTTQTLALPHDEILIDLDGWRKERV